MEMSRGEPQDDLVPVLIAGALDRYRNGDNSAARRSARQALAIVGGHSAAWRILAYATDGTDSPLRALSRVLAIDPTNADSLNDVAAIVAGSDAGRARQFLRRSLSLRPSAPSPWRGLGVLDRTENTTVARLKRSATLAPLDPATWQVLARETAARAQALAYACRGIALAPEAASGWVEHGLAIQNHDGWARALPSFRRATAADRLSAAAWHNRAAAAMAVGDFAEGDRALARALSLEPSLVSALLLRGNRAIEHGAATGARRHYGRTMAAAADFAEATLNLAMLDLLDGQYPQGWRGFAARWHCRSHRHFRPTPGAAPWDGAADPAKRLFLRAEPEQALGDTLQFARFAPLAAQRVGKVLLECDPLLVRLLDRTPGVGRTVPLGADPGPVDLSCGLMDLGALYAPTLDSLPRSPPYLIADEGAVAVWRTRLASVPRPWIGICWRGNPHFRMDRWRSPGLAPLSPVFRRGAGHLVSLTLQYQPGEYLPSGVADPMTLIADMADTAALVASLDLVITSDTSVAHLAGGLGRRTWVMLHEPADWRWLRHRHDSPWYPTVRLFRQQRPGDWTGVANEVASALNQVLV
jgi:tetratricopeptide (TPR) repeat protein